MVNLRRFKADLGWVLIRLFVAGVRRLDLPSVVRVGRFAGWLSSYLLSLRKSVSLLNLDVAFGDGLTRRRKCRIFRRAAGYAMTLGLETVRYCFEHSEALLNNVEISGLEHLAAARSAGRGVILAGGHVGLFTLVAVRLSREGYPTWVIIRPAHDPRVSGLYREMLERLDANWISDRPREQCVRECLARLRSNDILHVLIDQKPARGTGCVVPFFDMPTEMFPGVVSLALKTGAPVLPVTIHRAGLTKHFIEIGPPVEIIRSSPRARRENVAGNLARVVKTLEDAIRTYPEEWWVISRRWTVQQLAMRRHTR